MYEIFYNIDVHMSLNNELKKNVFFIYYAISNLSKIFLKIIQLVFIGEFVFLPARMCIY